MTDKEEILYREKIMTKAYEGIKLTREERSWLVTHSAYNRCLGFPFLNISVEKLEPKQWYLLKINVESISYDDKIYPVIYVPDSKGKIITDFDVEDINYRLKKRGTPIKMLAFDGEDSLYHEVKYMSDLGLLSVLYELLEYDERMQIERPWSTFGGYISLGMIREQINDHMVRYRCKSNNKDSFDAMVFTVEWVKID